MRKITFLDWTVELPEKLIGVTDIPMKKMVIMEKVLNLNAVIWIDETDHLQIKPTWDCTIKIDAENKILTLRHVDDVFYNDNE